jgi:hypothetical protein
MSSMVFESSLTFRLINWVVIVSWGRGNVLTVFKNFIKMFEVVHNYVAVFF